MNSVDSNDDWVEPEKKTLLQKILGCVQSIGFFTACFIFTLIFWAVFIPAFYFGMESRCITRYNCPPFPDYWRYFFWMVTSGIWVIIISAAICYYSCVYGRDDSDDEDEEDEEKDGKEQGENDQKKCNNFDKKTTTGKSA